ncbi:MAG: FGGY family carbohydrate kinase [Paraglaciecola sp.]|nr:FGGY family carbohydrate kinase [Paraglaciecola sp.]
MSEQVTLVFDIGKTHVKLQVVDCNLQPLIEAKTKNQVLQGQPYPQADVEGIWHWLVATLSDWTITESITDIVVTTHGATAALVNPALSHERALTLPILDYEYSDINDFAAEYNQLRPDFSETFSPALPAGLNLGRQLFWLSRKFPTEFAQASHILMYPQYWIWRLTGHCSTEVTSLGCHTDLWAPATKQYSSLVKKLAWSKRLGKPTSAWLEVAKVQASVAHLTGLSAQCRVFGGLHDSNASYLRYLQSQNKQDFTVISSGTWTILMSSAQGVSLDERKDMLANVDVNGHPVACARFMGGREYETICAKLGGDVVQDESEQALLHVLQQQYMVTPDFSEGNGPFGGNIPVIQAPAKSQYAQAIATLYCALMIDYQLSQLNACGNIYIEGAFIQNRLMCQLVAQLRQDQSLYLSSDGSGTVQGAAMLSQWHKASAALHHDRCYASEFDELIAYKQHWLTLLN